MLLWVSISFAELVVEPLVLLVVSPLVVVVVSSVLLVCVVLDVALRVGVIFLLNLVSPVQLSPSSLLCSSCLESCFGFSCSCSCSCPCLLMMVSRQSSSSFSGIGQPCEKCFAWLFVNFGGVVAIKFPVVSVSTKDLSQPLVCVCEWFDLFLLLFCFLCRLSHNNGFSIVCSKMSNL